MHDIDQTQTYFEDTGEDTFGEGPLGFETFDPEMGFDGAMEGPFSQDEEIDLASELLSVSSDQEIDQFLGKLFKQAWRGIKRVAPGIVRPLGGILKGVAKSALPLVGGALGSLIPIPGVGTALGAAAGSAAGKLFGLEIEGLSGEDQDFEVARRFVRLAGSAAQQAANASPASNPQAAAQAAVKSAAQQHAPGLAGASSSRTGMAGYGRSGRWIRRGQRIILLGV